MPQNVTCPSCNRSFAYKPELAGKRVKCKCGGKFDFPDEKQVLLLDLDATGHAMAAGGEELGLGGTEENYDLPRESAAVVPPVVAAPPTLPQASALCCKCRSPLQTGAVLCTQCGTNQRTGGAIRTQVVSRPTSAPRATASRGGSGAGVGNMLLGGILVVGGLAVTIGTYSAASERGGTYFVFWGPVIFGAFRFFKGLGQMMSGE